jgi:gluconokinase
MLLTAKPGEHDLTVLPLLAGERSPGWWLNASGVISGLRLGTSPVEILHALLEAVSLRLSMIAEQLGEADRVYAGGGALHKSAAWSQMMADVLGVPLHLLATPEVTARGTALLMLHALDNTRLDAHPAPMRAIYEPRSHYANRWQTLRQKQKSLYNRLRSES